MPPTPSPNALDADPQALPVLTSAQIDRIRPLGHIRSVESGETLYKPNDSAVPFFVVLSGQMEVLRPTLDGERLCLPWETLARGLLREWRRPWGRTPSAFTWFIRLWPSYRR